MIDTLIDNLLAQATHAVQTALLMTQAILLGCSPLFLSTAIAVVVLTMAE